jgi:hypothetical protein
MDILSINDKPRYFIRFGIGIIFIISGIANFIPNYTAVHFKDGLFLALFVLAGIANMTNDFGISRIYFKVFDEAIVIKLYSKIKSRSFQASDISSITLNKTLILFELKNGESFKIRLNTFGLTQKTQIYDFMIHYAKENEIVIKRFPLENNMTTLS